MPEFNKVEDTLFVPMLGRIYASENFPNILNDKKALELKDKLPKNIKGKDTQTQYTFMASAVRSVNMDRYIQDFMKRNDNGIIVQLGCGLETTFYRNDNGKNIWYEFDLEPVINYRKELLGENERDIQMAMDAFSEEWIKLVRKEHPTEPILVAASGLFYYFTEDNVKDLFKTLKKYGDIELLFDTVNKSGIRQMTKKYMKQVGHEGTEMFFYVENVEELAKEVGATVIKEEPYYKYIDKKGFNFMTSISMKVSDKLMMVKMEHLKLN